MRKGWVYNKKTGSWKKEHQSKISNKELVYDPKTGSFGKGSSKKRVKSKKLRPGSYSIKKPGHIDRVNKKNKKFDEDWSYNPKTGSFASRSSKKKTKSKEPSPEDKNHIDWVDKWGKREETNKVPDYVPQEEKTDTKKDGGNVWNVLGPILGIVALIFWAFVIFDLGSSGIKKGAKYLDERSSQKVRCAERADSASTSYAAKKIYKACMSR